MDDWAWLRYNRLARSRPHACITRAYWYMHVASSRGRNEPMATGSTRQARQTRQAIEDVRVKAVFDMTPEEFALHFTNRHADSLAGADHLPADMPMDVQEAYKSFHFRLHKIGTRYQLKHHHDPEPPEFGIDRAIRALMSNNHRGWVELASCQGRYVAVFPDGDIATRIDGVVRYHDTVEDATDTILHPPKPKRRAS